MSVAIDVVLVVTGGTVVTVGAVVAGAALLVDEATGRVVSTTVPPQALIATAMREIADLAFIRSAPINQSNDCSRPRVPMDNPRSFSLA